MRIGQALCASVVGLGLVAASTTRANDIDQNCPKCQKGKPTGLFHHHPHKHLKQAAPIHVCSKCMKKLESGEVSMPPGAVAYEGAPVGEVCESCKAAMESSNMPLVLDPKFTPGAPAEAYAGLNHHAIKQDEEIAGHAVVGEEPAGHAMVGEALPLSEPTPVGVMRTHYDPSMEEASPYAAGNEMGKVDHAAKPGRAVVDKTAKSSSKPNPNQEDGMIKSRPSKMEGVRELASSWVRVLPGVSFIRGRRQDPARVAHARETFKNSEDKVDSIPASMIKNEK